MTCLALTAGDALAHVEVFRSADLKLRRLSNPPIEMIAGAVRDSYVEQRLAAVEQKVLAARGWTLHQFYTEVPKTGVPGDLIISIDAQISRYDYGLDILLAGVDSEAHIYNIRNPGRMDCFDALGYHSIGSGEMHALSVLIFNGCCPDWDRKKTAFHVYEAKRNAEVAPGVGKALDMAIITGDGVYFLEEDALEALAEIYQRKAAPALADLDELISSVPLGGQS